MKNSVSAAVSEAARQLHWCLVGSILLSTACGGRASSDIANESVGGATSFGGAASTGGAKLSGGYVSTGGMTGTIISAISAGDEDTCTIVNGGVQWWGLNSISLFPVQVPGLASGVTGISAGGSQTCAIVDGGVQCWGRNNYGQLGNNSVIDSLVPVQAEGLTSGVTAITAGWGHTCALVNGGAQCWGNNIDVQLGNDFASIGLVPVQVQNLASGVTGISAGYRHTCAIVDGGARCWGGNDYGQLGNNSTATYSVVPVQVQGLASGVTAISTGWDHTCALVNGGAQCWGSNDYGQLGNNSTTNSLAPIQVQSLTSGTTAIAAISAGFNHTCAIVDGGAQCWGGNDHGQLGNSSTTTYSAVPVQVEGLTSGVTAIDAGRNFTCALVDGGLQCWGDNSYGQLGNNSMIDSTVPVKVQFP